jgi:hypothetical protein
VSDKSVLYGVEAGYGFTVAIVTLRAQVGVGNYTRMETQSASVQAVAVGAIPPNANLNSIYAEPAITAIVSFGRLIIGIYEGTLSIPALGDWQPAFVPGGQVGVRF